MPPTLLPLSTGPRLVLYAQTHHNSSGAPISLLPLITQNTGVTHVIIAAIHLNEGPGNITLNDDPFDAEKFRTLWGEVAWLRGAGVKVLGMLGGAARGSFERLGGSESEFESYYAPLHALLQRHPLDGLDLDIEEAVPLSTPTRLLTRLRADFGPSFLLTLAPVATALLPDPAIPAPSRPPTVPLNAPNPLHPSLPHLSGFSYAELEASPAGRLVSWYNTQFYCGWGDARSTMWYDAIIASGWHPRKVVLGVVTNPGNGAGFVSLAALQEVCGVLRARYEGMGGFGGVMGWEYFNAGGAEEDQGTVRAAVCAAITAPSSSSSSSLPATSSPPATASDPAGWSKSLGLVLRSAVPPSVSSLPPPPSTPAPATLPEPDVPWPGEDVNALIVLGFSRQEAVAALNATDGHVEMAAGLLFER